MCKPRFKKGDILQFEDSMGKISFLEVHHTEQFGDAFEYHDKFGGFLFDDGTLTKVDKNSQLYKDYLKYLELKKIFD